MEKDTRTASQIISFVTYKEDEHFKSYLNPKKIVLKIPNELISLFENRQDMSGVFFTGVPEKDRYYWSLMWQRGSVVDFLTQIVIIGKPFFIFAPKEVTRLLNQEFIKVGVYIYEYGRKAKLIPSGFCEIYDTGTSLAIKDVEPVCFN